MERWNRALDAVEACLDGDIDVAELARVAVTSEYQLRRVFSVLAGMPLSDYIRRRRMTVAAGAIRDGHEAVQDVAVRYGYTSADAFSRAFRAVHGIGPEQARRPGAVLRSQPRLSFHLTVEGRNEMEYRIVEKDAFRLVGHRTRTTVVHQGMNPELEAFHEALGEAEFERVENLSDQEPGGLLAAFVLQDDTRAEGTATDYYAAAATSRPAPADLDELDVPARTWAVFAASGPFPQSLEQLWRTVGGEWLPANPYRLVGGPEIVRAEYDDDGVRADVELWLAVDPVS